MEKLFQCIECDYSNGNQPVLITDGILWKGREWWGIAKHNDDNVAIEWETNVEVADEKNVTMTTVSISFPKDGHMSIVPMNSLEGKPVLIHNTLQRSSVYWGSSYKWHFQNEDEAHRFAEKLIEAEINNI